METYRCIGILTLETILPVKEKTVGFTFLASQCKHCLLKGGNYSMAVNAIASFCAAHGLRLDKHLGQHFLRDEEVLRDIVEAAKIEADDHIVEIGPGIGVLTKELLKRARKVTAIELDDRLIPLLKQFVTKNYELGTSNLAIVHGNALQTPMPSDPYKVVANIPYSVTSPLLHHLFLESATKPTSLTLLLQREVAEKICLPVRRSRGSKAGDVKGTGMLTIIVGLFGKPKLIRTVPSSAFLPPPKVESAVLRIECFTKPLAEAAVLNRVFELVKTCFSKKRKMLRNTLGKTEGGTRLLQSCAIAETRRPETLAVEEWLDLASCP
jgi:16S rRNA (adenine1518-N6/adenine1519-N6)-dimethyltransferase